MKSYAEFVSEGKIELKNQPVFVRFGGLSSVPQDGYTTNPEASFHSPPARRGVYAFVVPFVDTFLLGGKDFDPRRQEYVRDHRGEIITNDHPDYEKMMNRGQFKYGTRELKDGRYALVVNKKPVKFHYDGPIWSHLTDKVSHEEVLATKGSWIKTEMPTYVKALRKEIGEYQFHKQRTGFGYTVDHMEVFMEKV